MSTFNIEQVLATHREIFGNARMEGEGEGGGDGGGSGAPNESATGAGASGPPAGEPKTYTAEEYSQLQSNSRKWEQRAKDNHDKAKQFDELENAKKDELTREREAREAAEGTATNVAQENLRLRVALEKGLPKELIDRLQGSTQEEMETDAETLLAFVKGSGGDTKTPRSSTDSGPRGSESDGQELTLQQQIAAAQGKGDSTEVMRLNTLLIAQLAANA